MMCNNSFHYISFTGLSLIGRSRRGVKRRKEYSRIHFYTVTPKLSELSTPIYRTKQILLVYREESKRLFTNHNDCIVTLTQYTHQPLKKFIYIKEDWIKFLENLQLGLYVFRDLIVNIFIKEIRGVIKILHPCKQV